MNSEISQLITFLYFGIFHLCGRLHKNQVAPHLGLQLRKSVISPVTGFNTCIMQSMTHP